MRTGLVLEGGGLRGIFTAGVLDCLMEEGIEFSYILGVSAGAGNEFNFLARQKGRSRRVINRPKDDTYYGPKEIIESHKIMNLDKVFGEYLYTVDPFDFDTFFANKTENEYVVSNCQTGKPEYLSEHENIERLCAIGKASCSLPVICPPVEIDGNFYIDGSVTDSMPIQHALEKGCDRILFISTKGDGMNPSDFGKFKIVMKRLYDKSFEPVIEACTVRTKLYYEQLAFSEEMEQQGKVLTIHPTSREFSIGHFETDNEKLDKLYFHGIDIAKERMPQIKKFLGK